jgi:hypothetical protein
MPSEPKKALDRATLSAGLFASRHGPCRRLGGEVPSDPPFAKLGKACAPTFPLFPDRRPQPTPEPRIKAMQDRRCLAEAAVASPSTQVRREFLRSLLHADSPCPARQLPNPSLEPQDRFRRNAPARLLAARKAESEKLPVLRWSHRTLRLIHFEFKLGGKCCSAFRLWSASLALPTARPTLPSADFRCRIRKNCFILSHFFCDLHRISRGKINRLPRTTAGFTTSAFDGYGLRYPSPARPAP